MLDIVEANYLNQMVNIAIHGKNTLDLFFVTSPDLFSNCRTVHGLCKHEAVVAEYELQTNLNKRRNRKVICIQ